MLNLGSFKDICSFMGTVSGTDEELKLVGHLLCEWQRKVI